MTDIATVPRVTLTHRVFGEHECPLIGQKTETMKKLTPDKKILVHTQKFHGGFLDGEVNYRERIAYWAVQDKVCNNRLDGGWLRSIYELHHLELESETRAIGHYQLKSQTFEADSLASESQREAAEFADGKPDGQAENDTSPSVDANE